MNESGCKTQDKIFNDPPQGEARINLFPHEQPKNLSEEEQKLKRQIYEQMKPRRRKFIDKLGFDNWDPFQAPKDPLDIRRDITQRTLQELLSAFIKTQPGEKRSKSWQNGVRECALGIITHDEKYQAIFDFCIWYYKELQKYNKA